jgi:single-strand DNA-binding protein
MYNRCQLMGNLGQDPELKQTQGGQTLLKFSLATSEKWKDKSGNQQERTEWHNCVLWGERGEKLARFLSKGQRIFVEGKIQYEKFEDRDGNKRTSTNINVLSITFCEKKGSGGGSSSSDDSGPSPYGGGYQDDGKKADKKGGAIDDDDIPFAPVSDIFY